MRQKTVRALFCSFLSDKKRYAHCSSKKKTVRALFEHTVRQKTVCGLFELTVWQKNEIRVVRTNCLTKIFCCFCSCTFVFFKVTSHGGSTAWYLEPNRLSSLLITQRIVLPSPSLLLYSSVSVNHSSYRRATHAIVVMDDLLNFNMAAILQNIYFRFCALQPNE